MFPPSFFTSCLQANFYCFYFFIVTMFLPCDFCCCCCCCFNCVWFCKSDKHDRVFFFCFLLRNISDLAHRFFDYLIHPNCWDSSCRLGLLFHTTTAMLTLTLKFSSAIFPPLFFFSFSQFGVGKKKKQKTLWSSCLLHDAVSRCHVAHQPEAGDA